MPDRLTIARQARGAVGEVALVLLLADRQAQVGPRAEAVDALPALGREQGDRVVADRDRAHVRAERLHDARALVPEHGRGISGRIDPRSGVHVGVADAAGDEPDQHLARPRISQVQLLDDERTAELLQHRGAYLHRRPSTLPLVRRSRRWRSSPDLRRCTWSQARSARRGGAAPEALWPESSHRSRRPGDRARCPTRSR